jgi:prephenate dehydrogenase
MHPVTFPVVSIVGGKGRMGQFFARYFSLQGSEVLLFDREHDLASPEVAGQLRRSDLVMLAVPISLACSLAEQICPLLGAGSLLCDVTSLKLRICEVMQRAAPGECLGLHPMFAPSIQGYAGHKIIFCPLRDGEKARALRAMLVASEFELQESAPEQHDRAVSVVQVLLHFAKFVGAHALRESGLSLAETLRFSSPVYTLELALIARLFGQDPALYEAIQRENPYAAEMRELFLRSAHAVAGLLESPSPAASATGSVSQELEASARWFGEFSEQAAALSEKLVGVVASARRDG